MILIRLDPLDARGKIFMSSEDFSKFDERANNQVTIKDLIEGAKAAAAIKDNAAWKAARPAQITVPEANLIDEVRKIIALHSIGPTS